MHLGAYAVLHLCVTRFGIARRAASRGARAGASQRWPRREVMPGSMTPAGRFYNSSSGNDIECRSNDILHHDNYQHTKVFLAAVMTSITILSRRITIVHVHSDIPRANVT